MSGAHAVVAPVEIWRTWNLDPIVAGALIATAWAYGQGLRRLWARGRGRAVSLRQASSFYGGLVVVALAFLSPLEALAATLFSAHMIQHLLLILVAPCLLVYGAPSVPVSLSLSPGTRRGLLAVSKSPAMRRVLVVASAPVAVWALLTATMWMWHLPALYEAALASEWLHVLEHSSFFITAIAFWSVVISPRRRAGAPPGVKIALVFGTLLQSGALGAILTFASSTLYPVHGPGAQAWGLTSLQDQQLAGVTMWVPVGVVYIVTMSVVFVRWMKGMEAQMRHVERSQASPAPARLGER